ncbi:response regulator [Desulfopila inferna]|nr:response regulator [Desulfopila inferna]MBM9605209.1 response regulator [Desulfopila inferna]
MMNTADTHFPQILLVEDNSDDALLTLEALQSSNLPVGTHIVTDGIAALAFLRKEGKYRGKPRPDLVLLDLNLPLMSGHEVLEEIRNDDNLTGLPVIILTTSEDEEDIRKAYKLHANCYITKNIDFFKFTEIIRQVEEFWLQLVKLPR